MSGIQKIYSSRKSAGLVVATGTEGRFRGPAEDAGMYLSRNGGFNWEKIKEGAQITSIAHHGSLFVMASVEGPTNKLSYSWTQGEDWESCSFTDADMTVDSLLDMSPSEEETVFMIVGDREDLTGGFVSAVEFTDNTPRYCTGFEAPGSLDSDFETVEPQAHGSCLLGRRSLVTRRKRDAACLSLNSERTSVEGSCPCKREDYTCDGVCWKEDRAENGDIVCVNDCAGLQNDPMAPPEDCEGTYLAPSGYRLVDDDMCVDGVRMDEPIETACPGGPISSTPSPAPPAPSATVLPPKPVTPVTTDNTTTDETDSNGDTSIGMIVGAIVVSFVILFVFLFFLLLLLYKVSPQ